MPNFKILTKYLNQDSNLECLVSNPNLINCYEKKAPNCTVFVSQQNLAYNFIHTIT